MPILKVFEDTEDRDEVSFERGALSNMVSDDVTEGVIRRSCRDQCAEQLDLSSVCLGLHSGIRHMKNVFAQTAAFQGVESTDWDGIIAAVFSDWAGLKELQLHEGKKCRCVWLV